jgi:hypothetical protein
LANFSFVFADSDVLTHPKSGYRSLYLTVSGTHLIPYGGYIRIAYFGQRHTGGAVNRVVGRDKFREYVFLSVRIFIRKIFVQPISDSTMTPLYYGAFHVGISTDLKINSLFL